MGYNLLGGSTFIYDRTPLYEDCDSAGHSIGHKEIEGNNVYIIAVRETTSNEEWIINFCLGVNE